MIDTFTIRCNILRLAFSGKLTEQLETDEIAKKLLSRITTKNIEQTRDFPYEIPDSWVWVKLGDLYKINPKVIAEDTADAAFIPMKSISAGFDQAFSFKTLRWEQASKNHTKFENGDVAFAKITPCFENRKSFIAHDLPNGIGAGTTELIILRQSEMLPTYTYFLLLEQRFINTGVASYKGTVGQQRVQSDILKNYYVPVAPFQEQQRIVKKIEQAFTVLDTIDRLQKQYNNNRVALKRKLIEAAIQGKLTEQLPEDGTAEELFAQIQAEKHALIKAKKIKKEKPLPPINKDEIPFEVPKSWRWCKFSELVTYQLGSTPSRSNIGYWENGCFPWFTITDMNSPNLLQSKEHITSLAVTNCFPNGITPKGTLLMSFKLTIGKVGILRTDAFHNEAIISIYPIHDYNNIFQSYLMYILPVVAKTGNIYSAIKGNTLNKTSISNLLIPFPPLAEQKRIVSKLDELLSIIDG